LDYVRQYLERDYETYSGYVLESIFRQLLAESKFLFRRAKLLGPERRENEIDIIAVNDFEKRLLIGEVKRNRERINLHILENKAAEIVQKVTDISN
jgi:AAA+ ATPase superfamily predicted ATPase